VMAGRRDDWAGGSTLSANGAPSERPGGARPHRHQVKNWAGSKLPLTVMLGPGPSIG